MKILALEMYTAINAQPLTIVRPDGSSSSSAQPDKVVDDKENIRKLISQLSSIQAEKVQKESPAVTA